MEKEDLEKLAYNPNFSDYASSSSVNFENFQSIAVCVYRSLKKSENDRNLSVHEINFLSTFDSYLTGFITDLDMFVYVRNFFCG